MSKVIVIGGGASGLVAAIYAAKEYNNVMILERNSNCGKKLLITGNGRCNYYNEDQNIEHYHTTNNNVDLKEIINQKSNVENLHFFESIGIMPKIKNGYYYPLSNQAISILNALVIEAELLNVDIKNNVTVSDVIKEDNLFKVITDYEVYECDKLIVATGSKAAPKTGSDGFGYQLLQKFGHTIIKPLPALVQLICEDAITKDWDGVRSDALVSVYTNSIKQQEEYGEIMLTEYGVSGICVFNLSGIVAKELDNGNNVTLKINFIPSLNLNDIEDAFNWFSEYNHKVKNRSVSQLLDGFLNYKLVNAILKNIKIDRDAEWDELSNVQQKSIIKSLIGYEIKVVGTNSFDKAQICSGGVSLDEINIKTMESKIIPNLHITGELVDVDGDCGGYNLNWAWTSGKLAGKGTKCDD